MYALTIAKDGRVLSATYAEYANEKSISVEALPEGNITDYRIEGNSFIHDPIPKVEVDEEIDLYERISELEAALELLLSGVTE